MSKRTLKSIGAVLAGFLTVFILSSVTDFILEAVGVLPSLDVQQSQGLYDTNLLILALLYRSLYTVLGGFVTATLSPGNPMKHVIILGIIGTIAGIIGVIAGWHLSAHWYPIALAVTGFPLIWLGGKLKLMIKNSQKARLNDAVTTS
jgi:hypothetical protein